jgi:3-phosphoshikimate 1-carboxyvinyltransferase
MAKSLKGEITVPGDKSISHRSLMLGSISEGRTRIKGLLRGADCLSTMSCMRALGVSIDDNGNEIVVHGVGLNGLKKPAQMLYTGNSGTTTRILSGILAGQPFETTITGDESIEKRPMKRIITPLSLMNADISSVNGNDCAPLSIKPSTLHGINYDSPVASAQVKSCILLAGLYADAPTTVTEPALSRNHTELMLRAFGADIETSGYSATVTPGNTLHGQDIQIPGDISSAAYFIAAGLIVKDSEILISNVNINPTRAGIIKVVKSMGGTIDILNERIVSGEPVADLYVKSSHLHGTEIGGADIPTLIDEIPIIAILAANADGQTIIRDASELHVKESDRIKSISENLTRMGSDIMPTSDGMIIYGGARLHSAKIKTMKDHRIAMAFSIASLALDEDNSIDDMDCVNISYPGFFETLSSIINN